MKDLTEHLKVVYNATLKGFVVIGALGLAVTVLKDGKKIED